MIAWKYINKNAATIAAMRDYGNMRYIVANTPDATKEVHNRMVSPRAATITGMPTAQYGNAGSERLPEQIDKIDAYRERYGAAVAYMEWFQPAWFELDETERHVLCEFYMSKSLNSGATYRLADEYSCSERKIDSMRYNALKNLKTLLFG